MEYRIDNFPGNDKQYIAYLEQQLNFVRWQQAYITIPPFFGETDLGDTAGLLDTPLLDNSLFGYSLSNNSLSSNAPSENPLSDNSLSDSSLFGSPLVDTTSPENTFTPSTTTISLSSISSCTAARPPICAPPVPPSWELARQRNEVAQARHERFFGLKRAYETALPPSPILVSDDDRQRITFINAYSKSYHQNPRPPKKPLAKWRGVAKTLLSETPDNRDWTAKLKQSGLLGILNSSDAVTYLLDNGQRCDPDKIITPEESPSSIEAENLTAEVYRPADRAVLQRVLAFARASSRRKAAVDVDSILSQFQQIVILSACAVLQRQGFSEVHVYEIARQALGQVTDDYCRRMIKVAVWINKLIDALDLMGWGHHAIELLLLWNRPISFFRQFTTSVDESVDWLADSLQERVVIDDTMATSTGDEYIAINIPCFVRIILGAEIS